MGIHETTLQSMWKKASELVTTDGMIVPVLGEKDCLDYIAVAEVHGKLSELLSYHSKGSFDPNLSSMVLFGMPSTSGKKPGKNQ